MLSVVLPAGFEPPRFTMGFALRLEYAVGWMGVWVADCEGDHGNGMEASFGQLSGLT